MIQMHYDNPRQQSSMISQIDHRMSKDIVQSDLDRMDSSGIRYYLGPTRRQNELGYFTLGTTPGLTGIAIPPRVDRFNVDSYCPAVASNVRMQLRSVREFHVGLDPCLCHADVSGVGHHGDWCVSAHSSARQKCVDEDHSQSNSRAILVQCRGVRLQLSVQQSLS